MSIFRGYLPKYLAVIAGMFPPLNLAALAKALPFFQGQIASKEELSRLGRQIMGSYSFLYIDTEEHIGRSTQTECPTDEKALEAARFGMDNGLSP